MKKFLTLSVIFLFAAAFAHQAQGQVRMHEGALHFYMNAQNLYEKGEIAQALGACEDALILAKDTDGSVNLLKGMCHLQREENEEAIAAFEKAVEYNPDLIEAHLYLVDLYEAANLPEKLAKQQEIVARLESNQ